MVPYRACSGFSEAGHISVSSFFILALAVAILKNPVSAHCDQFLLIVQLLWVFKILSCVECVLGCTVSYFTLFFYLNFVQSQWHNTSICETFVKFSNFCFAFHLYTV